MTGKSMDDSALLGLKVDDAFYLGQVRAHAETDKI